MNRICFAFAISIFLFGCTIAPDRVKQNQASFDPIADKSGNVQNSGILGITNHLWIITPSARDRYNGLVAVFGGGFTPPVVKDAGLTPLATNSVLWLMDSQHMDYFAIMTARKANPPAPKPP